VRRSVRVRLTAALAVAASALIAPLAIGAGAPAAAAPSGDDALVRQLRDASGGHARIDKLEGTGKVRFVGTPAGKAIRRPSGVTANTAPETAARAFLKGYGRLFGVRDAARELKLAKTRTGTGGVRTVRFQQVHDGIPVVGGDLVVQLQPDNDVVSAYGETTARPATTKPSVSAATARAAALARIAKAHKVEASTLRAATPALAIFDSRLLGAPGRGVPALVWRTEVTAATGHEMREFVLVDAARGTVVLHFDQLAHADAVKKVCDKANVTSSSDACSSPVANPAASGVVDVRNGFNFAENTFDFYFDRFGRNSIDGAGMTMTTVVRFCPTGFDCLGVDPTVPDGPYENAYWNGTHTVYGDGFAVDDVVAHEFTHGVTEFESHLFYYYQSGAINEALSDVFGEFVDQGNGAGNDDPAVKWLMGEDLAAGAIRSMADPTLFNDPDRMTSPEWDDLTSVQDRGGVHGNSGVLNKAAYLVTDGTANEPGGQFNGQTVTGLGTTKAARIFYDAALMLTSASEYKDLNNIVAQACDTAAAAGTDGITTLNCDEVDKVLLAVEMHLSPPSRTTTNVFAPKCAPGQLLVKQFSDSLENPATHNTNWLRASRVDPEPNGSYVTNPSPIGRWYLPQTAQPYQGWDPTYATSGVVNMWGDDAEPNFDSTIARRANVVPLATSYLQFNHAYGFEHDPGGFYDGGRVEYSLDSGASWIAVPESWFTDNAYNGTVSTAPASFPNHDSLLAGKRAFVADSKGYTTSRISLAGIAGKSMRFRFRIATDFTGGADGWYVDDISVYACLTAPFNTSLTLASSKSAIVAGSSVTLSGKLVYTGTPGGIAGQSVRLYGRPNGATSWGAPLATLTTSSTGGYSFVHKPTRNFEYTSRFSASGDFKTATNPKTVDVGVAPKITGTLSKTTMPLGTTSYLSGSVSPSHAGRTVRLQRYYSGAWHNVASKVLSSTSRYRFAIKPGTRGTFKYRVVLAAHSDHIAGKSPTATLKVT
jgi:bacillolysin